MFFIFHIHSCLKLGQNEVKEIYMWKREEIQV